ncbi:hypothetical protein PINS_up011953 [Pythium insidiosum]|nr:hypothetical protein PINS_up011953 [Pythium insidiosum]
MFGVIKHGVYANCDCHRISFDLFFAVFAPLEVLIYSKYNFTIDRGDFAVKAETLGPGNYDGIARLFSDPAQISVFRIAFHYLQFYDVGTLLIKVALNALSLFKWWRTIFHLVENSRQRQRKLETNTEATESLHKPQAKPEVKPRRLHNYLIASLFFLAGVAVFVYSIVAVVSTRQVCRPYSQCVVPSYRWNIGDAPCSCIVYVDRSLRLTKYSEWQDPPDTTANLAALAASGHLHIVQIINRALPRFPEELRRCKHLEQVILIYTKTERFPDWFKEFKHLEYLHVEGDFTPRRLTYMPQDMLSDMPSLMFLHLGCLPSLPAVPDLRGSPQLRYLVLAVLHSVQELPSVEHLKYLKTFTIVDGTSLSELPSLSSLTSLVSFALTYINPVCCNGYVTGACDLSKFYCQPRTGLRAPTCVTERMSDASKAVVARVGGTLCDDRTVDLEASAPSTLTVDTLCGGVRYKQCSVNGAAGICYNVRMMVLTCDASGRYELMRRMEIARGVGEPCDPVVEAWLGCTAKS